MGSPRLSSSSSQTRLILQQTESPLSFRIPARQQSVSQEAAAPWLMATAIRALIRTQRGQLGFPIAWRSSSILTKTVGILRLTGMSVMWPFRAAARDAIRHTMASYAGETQVQTRLWGARS